MILLASIVIVIVIISIVTYNWFIHGWHTVKNEEYILIASYKGQITNIKEKGLALVPWPFKNVREKIIKKLESINIDNFEVLCRADAKLAKKLLERGVDLTESLMAMVTTAVSLAYKIDFDLKNADKQIISNKLNCYFELFEMQKDGTRDNKKFLEIIKDIVQNVIREAINKIDEAERQKGNIGFDLIAAQKFHIGSPRFKTKIQDACDEMSLPIKIVDFQLNTPLVIADKEIAGLYETLAKSLYETEALQISLDREKLKMQKEMEIKNIEATEKLKISQLQAQGDISLRHYEGEAKKAYMAQVLKAFGLGKLPPEQQSAFLFELEKLEYFKAIAESPNKTLVISSDIGAQIQGILSKMGIK